MISQVAELVERQLRSWELRSKDAAPAHPCVALSRLPYSQGEELGERIAKRLGYTCFGIQIVDLIAREAGISRRLVEGVDERIRSSIERFVVDAFRTGGFNESDYIRQVVQTVVSLGEQGGAVIVGRGAPFILPAQRCLRVLVTAPTADRVARIAKDLALTSAEEAKRRLADEDHARREFLRRDFGLERPEEPGFFDLAVNTDALGLDGAADLVVAALRLRFPYTAESAPSI